MRTGRYHLRLGSPGLVVLLFITGLFCLGCNPPEPTPKPKPLMPGGQAAGAQLKPAPPRPDLAVASTQVYNNPQKPRHIMFTVDVTNLGNAPSGDYDLLMNIKDVSRGAVYPVGTFRRTTMKPGEKYCVYQEMDRMVNNSGPHQLYVEIRPFMFEDGNPSNNIVTKDFYVN